MAGSKSVSFRPGPVFDRQGSPAWGLTVESMGKILDTLGCVLAVGKNRFALRPIGRPKHVAGCWIVRMSAVLRQPLASMQSGRNRR